MTRSTGSIVLLLSALALLSGCDQLRPMANFTFTPDEGVAPLNVSFTNHSRPGPGLVMRYSWDFGDGSARSNEENPVHEYKTPGIYTISLTVYTSMGMDTMTRYGAVHVRELKQEVNVDFTAAPAMGPPPLAVQFTDMTTASNATIRAWHWDFGDGVVSNERHPYHTYASPGQYTVSLALDADIGRFKSIKPIW